MNHYEVLGLSQDCSDDDIKKAWRKVARVTHSDTASADGAGHLYLAAKEAYDTLIDPAKRAAYDRSLKVSGSSSAGASSSASYSSPPEDAFWGAGVPYDTGQPSGRGEQGYGNGAPWAGKGQGYGFPGSVYGEGEYGPSDSGYSSYSYPSEGVNYSHEKSSSKSPRGLVHRASWTVWAGALMILVPMLTLYEPVAGGLNAWGLTFLVAGALMLGLVVQGGTGYRDWKWWAWVVMGVWFASTQDVGWWAVAYFTVPAVGAVLPMWQDGAAPVEASKKKAAVNV